MTITTRLGELITSFRYQDLTEDALHWARIGLLDTVGVTLAGANEASVRILRETTLFPGVSGPAVQFGAAGRVPPLDAAMINGTAAHALDYDDASNSLAGHISAAIVPALFALADWRGASGRAFLTAYVVGWETQSRIARAVNLHHYEKGWHPTATLGVFGVTAACAKLLGLSPEATARALSIAASLSSGLKANMGTMTKPLHVGQTARSGLMAATLAGNGFTAAADAFEHRQGFLLVFNGEGNYDVDRIFAEWAAPLDIVKPGLAVKQYPCCASTHPAVDVMIDLVTRHNVKPEDVERIQSWTHPRRLAHTNRPEPKSGLDAKFSVQYCLARVLKDGGIRLDHFEGDAFRDPEIRALTRKVEAAPHPEMKAESSDHFGGEVRIHKHNGEVLAAKVDRALGRGPEKPLPLARIRAKFDDCARQALSPAAADELAARLAAFEKVEDVRSVTALTSLQEAPPRAAA